MQSTQNTLEASKQVVTNSSSEPNLETGQVLGISQERAFQEEEPGSDWKLFCFFTHLGYCGTVADCGCCRVQPAFHTPSESSRDP